MSALDIVLAAHDRVVTVEPDEHQEELKDAAALLLATAAGDGLAEAVRLVRALRFEAIPAELVPVANLVLSAGVAMEGFSHVLELPPTDMGLSAWVEETAFDVRALRLAGGSDSDGKSPYGNVKYADPGYQSDGKKRYPIDTEAHCRAAWSYINKGNNASQYSSGDLAKVKAAIKSACKGLGISISGSDGDADDTQKVAASNVALARGGSPNFRSSGAGSDTGMSQEIVHVSHRPMHGMHSHAHVHVNDNYHGPRTMRMSAGPDIVGESTATMHKPMTGAHGHAHVHAGDGSHGPMQELADEARSPSDSSWS